MATCPLAALTSRLEDIRRVTGMFTFNSYWRLRYVLVINVIAALVPATTVKGRANDPLRLATWWHANLHSAVLVVALAAILGSALVLVTNRKELQPWWVFLGCGVCAGDFPAAFYGFVAPAAAHVPLTELSITGTVCGLIAGMLLNVLLGSRKPSAAA